MHELLNVASFDDLADLGEAVKGRCASLRIPYDSGAITDAIALVSRTRPVVRPPDRPTPPARDQQRSDLPRAQALLRYQDILHRCEAADPVKVMPAVRQLSDNEIRRRQCEADRAKAFAIVQREILDTAARADALEAQTEVAKADRP